MIDDKKDRLINLKYSYPIISKKKNMLSLKSTKKGTIIDIDLSELKSIFNEINKTYKEKGEQYSKSNIGEQKTNIPIKPISHEIDISFCIQVGDEIQKNDSILFYDKKIQDYERIFSKKINNIIKTKEITVIDEVESELEDFKSMMVKFIKSENSFQFEKYFDLYFKLAEEFLDQLQNPYSYEEAKRAMYHSFFIDSWPILDWLREHIMYLFHKAFSKNSLGEIFVKIRWFTYDLIELSQKKKDHLLFRLAFFLWKYQLFSLSKEKELFERTYYFFQKTSNASCL